MWATELLYQFAALVQRHHLRSEELILSLSCLYSMHFHEALYLHATLAQEFIGIVIGTPMKETKEMSVQKKNEVLWNGSGRTVPHLEVKFPQGKDQPTNQYPRRSHRQRAPRQSR
jgi:hypothetical protein